MAIRYYEQDVNAKLTAKRRLSSFLETIVHKHLPDINSIQLNFIFCQDAYLLQINQQYLNHDTYTDIITFDLSENKTSLQGEIYIIIERIQENATRFNTTYTHELHRVIFHGVLHLCGFKDKSANDKTIMQAMENDCLNNYFSQA